jgi:hypothetical protein
MANNFEEGPLRVARFPYRDGKGAPSVEVIYQARISGAETLLLLL